MAKNSSRSKGYRKTTEKTTGYTPREKKIMIIGFAVIAVAILCAAFLPDWIESFSLLKVEDGVVQGMEDNWLISNVGTSTKPKYRKIAEVDPPEGYALTKRDSLSSDENLTYAVYEPVESGIAQQLLAQTAKGDPESLISTLSTNMSIYGGEYLYTGESTQETIDGKTLYSTLIEYTMPASTGDMEADTTEAATAEPDTTGAPTAEPDTAEADTTEADTAEAGDAEKVYTQSAIVYVVSPLDGYSVVLTASNDGSDESAFADRDALLAFVKDWATTVRLEG